MKHLLSCLLLLCTLLACPLNANAEATLHHGYVVWNGDTLPLGPHTFYLDGRLTDQQAATQPYVFNTFQAAAAHFADAATGGRVRLLIAPWVYWIDDPDDRTVRKPKGGLPPLGMVVNCDTLELLGLTADAAHVVLASQRGQTMGADGNFTMFQFNTRDLRVSNLTMGNYLNVDLDYPLVPALSRRRVSDNIVQAQLAFQRGERLRATNCRFVSRLNLCPINGAADAHYSRCHFECTDDALNGTATYDDCHFDFYSSKPMWATRGDGTTFRRCTFNVKHQGAQYFTKHSSPVRLIDCRFILPNNNEVGWTPYPEPWLRCEQYGVTDQQGRPIIVGGSGAPCTVDLLARGMAAPPEGRLRLSMHQAELRTGDGALELNAELVGEGATPLTWRVEEGFGSMVKLDRVSDERYWLTATNYSDTTARFRVTVTTAQGYEAACLLTVVPQPAAAPVFRKRPRVTIRGGVATVAYAFAGAVKSDESKVVWYRVPADGAAPYAVSESREGHPASTYRLTADDAGHRLQVGVWPKVRGSVAGAMVKVTTDAPLKASQVTVTDTLYTDFHDFPTATSPAIKDGGWSVGGYKPADCQAWDWQVNDTIDYWQYGLSNNGCVGEGLYQTAQGARLLYTPRRDVQTGDMALELLVDPQKTAGQGFSSARGQYMDIGIKMDTRTLTGYALRIIRTTKYSDAVDFVLMVYQNGVAQPITAPVSSTCYRTNCTLRIALVGNQLTASASTTSPQPDGPLAREVKLQAQVAPTTFGGIMVQHTGTVGEGKTMLHHLKCVRASNAPQKAL